MQRIAANQRRFTARKKFRSN
ncbi:unnamed protein product [Victoria cruziana]